MDIYYIEYMHKEYERRVKSELWVRAALRARAERTDATAHLVGRGYRLVAGLVTTLWRRGRHIVRRWSGQHETVQSLPINHQL